MKLKAVSQAVCIALALVWDVNLGKLTAANAAVAAPADEVSCDIVQPRHPESPERTRRAFRISLGSLPEFSGSPGTVVGETWLDEQHLGLSLIHI